MLIAEQLAASGQPSFASLPAPLPAHTTLSPPRAAATFGSNLGLAQSFPGISGVPPTAYMDTLTQIQQNIAGQAAAAYKLSVPKVSRRGRSFVYFAWQCSKFFLRGTKKRCWQLSGKARIS